MPCSLFIRHIYYKGDLNVIFLTEKNKHTTQRNTTVHLNSVFFFYEIAEVYFSFFINCTVVQFHFLHLEINISVFCITLCCVCLTFLFGR